MSFPNLIISEPLDSLGLLFFNKIHWAFSVLFRKYLVWVVRRGIVCCLLNRISPSEKHSCFFLWSTCVCKKLKIMIGWHHELLVCVCVGRNLKMGQRIPYNNSAFRELADLHSKKSLVGCLLRRELYQFWTLGPSGLLGSLILRHIEEFCIYIEIVFNRE